MNVQKGMEGGGKHWSLREKEKKRLTDGPVSPFVDRSVGGRWMQSTGGAAGEG
jgi:hypothetical protein